MYKRQNIDGVNYKFYNYKDFNNKTFKVLAFIFIQLRYFLYILFYAQDYNIIYINTINPWGAAFACKLRKKSCIYHVHEAYPNPNVFQKIGIFFLKSCADKLICVSEFVKIFYNKNDSIVLYNSLGHGYKNNYISKSLNKPSIIMVCSLKKYKGISNFIELARIFPKINFELVISSKSKDVENYFKNISKSSNISIYQETSDLSEYYKRNHLILNLSLPDLIYETFGLSILEGMSYGLPALVPKYGGISEIVINDFNGYKIDPYDLNEISEKIQKSFGSNKYPVLSSNAYEFSRKFSYENYRKNILKILSETK